MIENSIPTLQTERLTLRAPVVEDFPAYARFMASARSAGMGGPFDTRVAWGIFCHGVALWRFFGHGALMIDLRSTRQCLGLVEINHGPRFPEKELGWQLYEGFEGHGYATEAGRALRDWAFGALALPTLVSYIGPDNSRSVAVAERLGASLDPEAPKQDEGDLVYRHFGPAKAESA